MRLASALAAAALACSAPARAQPQAPPDAEREWGEFPGEKARPVPPADPRVLPPLQRRPAAGVGAPRESEPAAKQQPPPPLEPNTVSMLGARPLGQWARGQSVVVGFPLVGLRALVGLTRWLDLGLGFDSFYGMMNEPRLVVRVAPLVGERWALALLFEGGYAWFTTRASAEVSGARWMTGRRNVNLQPALVVSYQGAHPRAARLFLRASYLFTLDTEPFQRVPLGGVPPRVQPGHNTGLALGAEFPMGARTSFVFQLGADLHLRDGDSALMPSAHLGLVTGL